MMRKIHRVALAAQLKTMLAALQPAFLPGRTDVAKALGAERRFTFTADYPGGKAFLLFYPAASATDDYFTIEVVWIGEPVTLEALGADPLQMATLCPWKDSTREQMSHKPASRLRIDDLWPDAPTHYRGSFAFSTAAARYCEKMFSLHQLPSQKAREEQAFTLLQDCVAEEKALTEEQAAKELAPAISLAHAAIIAAALPYFAEASTRLQASRKD